MGVDWGLGNERISEESRGPIYMKSFQLSIKHCFPTPYGDPVTHMLVIWDLLHITEFRTNLSSISPLPSKKKKKSDACHDRISRRNQQITKKEKKTSHNE